jgi:hypothetical protein
VWFEQDFPAPNVPQPENGRHNQESLEGKKMFIKIHRFFPFPLIKNVFHALSLFSPETHIQKQAALHDCLPRVMGTHKLK